MTKTIQAGREAGTNGQEYQTHHPEGRGIILQPEGHRKVNNWEQGRVCVFVGVICTHGVCKHGTQPRACLGQIN